MPMTVVSFLAFTLV